MCPAGASDALGAAAGGTEAAEAPGRSKCVSVLCVFHLCSRLLICGGVKGDDAEPERKLRDMHAIISLTSGMGRGCRRYRQHGRLRQQSSVVPGKVPMLAVGLPELQGALGTHLKPLIHHPGSD